MTGEQHIDYESLAQDALRGIVRRVLIHAAKSGLPGQHHFYIAFNTMAPGVSLSSRLKEKYPEEMTIVLQHRFWDLIVDEDRFEVKLTFDGIPERLVVPFTAIKVFFDPSVPYGLQFEGSDLAADVGRDPRSEGPDALDIAPPFGARRMRTRRTDTPDQASSAPRADKKPRTPVRKPRTPKSETPAEAPKARLAPAGGTSLKEARPKGLPSKPPDQPDAPANDTKVIQLDKFRKK